MRVGRFRDSLSCHRYRCRHPLHRPRRLAAPGGPILPLRHLLRSCGSPLPPCPGRNRILVRVLAISKNLTLSRCEHRQLKRQNYHGNTTTSKEPRSCAARLRRLDRTVIHFAVKS